MRVFRSKKGSNDAFSWSWSKLVNLIVAFVFIFIPIYAFIILITNSDYFERNYLDMDLALATEATLASPNDLIYYYDKDMNYFSVDVQENSISIYKKENGIIGKSIAKSYYINNPSKKIEYGEITPVIEKDKKGKESAIPIKLMILTDNKQVKLFNANDKILEYDQSWI